MSSPTRDGDHPFGSDRVTVTAGAPDLTRMPFFVSVPLPGPFRYSTRVGGRRRRRGGGGAVGSLVTGLFTLAWLMLTAAVWITVATYYVLILGGIYLLRGGAAGVRRYRAHPDRRAVGTSPG